MTVEMINGMVILLMESTIIHRTYPHKKFCELG